MERAIYYLLSDPFVLRNDSFDAVKVDRGSRVTVDLLKDIENTASEVYLFLPPLRCSFFHFEKKNNEAKWNYIKSHFHFEIEDKLPCDLQNYVFSSTESDSDLSVHAVGFDDLQIILNKCRPIIDRVKGIYSSLELLQGSISPGAEIILKDVTIECIQPKTILVSKRDSITDNSTVISEEKRPTESLHEYCANLMDTGIASFESCFLPQEVHLERKLTSAYKRTKKKFISIFLGFIMLTCYFAVASKYLEHQAALMTSKSKTLFHEKFGPSYKFSNLEKLAKIRLSDDENTRSYSINSLFNLIASAIESVEKEALSFKTLRFSSSKGLSIHVEFDTIADYKLFLETLNSDTSYSTSIKKIQSEPDNRIGATLNVN